MPHRSKSPLHIQRSPPYIRTQLPSPQPIPTRPEPQGSAKMESSSSAASSISVMPSAPAFAQGGCPQKSGPTHASQVQGRGPRDGGARCMGGGRPAAAARPPTGPPRHHPHRRLHLARPLSEIAPANPLRTFLVRRRSAPPTRYAPLRLATRRPRPLATPQSQPPAQAAWPSQPPAAPASLQPAHSTDACRGVREPRGSWLWSSMGLPLGLDKPTCSIMVRCSSDLERARVSVCARSWTTSFSAAACRAP